MNCCRQMHTTEKQFHSAWLLSRCMQETLQRYAVVLTILDKEKVISRSALERESKQVAERLSALYRTKLTRVLR